MKNLARLACVAISATLLLSGCVGLSVGGGSKSEIKRPTTGQQLIDLQKAKDAGAITEAEYQAEKAKLLENK